MPVNRSPITERFEPRDKDVRVVEEDARQNLPSEDIGDSAGTKKQDQIPCWIGLRKDRESSIHVYADASTKAFAAHTYIRVVDTDVSRREETWIDFSLVAGKT
jgi:hypothetical protein